MGNYGHPPPAQKQPPSPSDVLPVMPGGGPKLTTQMPGISEAGVQHVHVDPLAVHTGTEGPQI
jgi:hypothetical protein